MDKLTRIAGLLFLSNIKEYQDSAIQLLNGDLTLAAAKKNPKLKKQIKELENITTEAIDKDTRLKILQFVEEYLEYEIPISQ